MELGTYILWARGHNCGMRGHPELSLVGRDDQPWPGYFYTYIYLQLRIYNRRVTTCLENLEMSGNLTAVREMSGILLKIRELSGKSCQKLYCKLHICVHPYRYLVGVCCVLNGIWFWIMYCCIPTPATDSNTRTGMIWLTLNMPSAANRQGISHCLESGHLVIDVCMHGEPASKET